jgi:hypothetical protein
MDAVRTDYYFGGTYGFPGETTTPIVLRPVETRTGYGANLAQCRRSTGSDGLVRSRGLERTPRPQAVLEISRGAIFVGGIDAILEVLRETS